MNPIYDCPEIKNLKEYRLTNINRRILKDDDMSEILINDQGTFISYIIFF